jgi:uncharacterized protein (TIGR03790 family)
MLRRAFLLLCALSACGDETASGTPGPTGPGGAGGGDTGGAGGGGGDVRPTVVLPRSSIDASEIGVIVNDQDPQSVAVAAHYQEARGIPAEHVYTLSFAPSGPVMTAAEFATQKAALDARVDPAIQAYAITWTQPFQVECMSVTSAFALGFDTIYCNTTGMACGPTAAVPYFDSPSFAPFTDHGIRPAMAIVGATAEDAIAVIDRGVASDGTFPTGDGWLVRTTDVARSVRWQDFIATVDAWSHPEGLALTYVDNSGGAGLDYIENTTDVLFYFTGLASVPAIETNTYLPGAIADHLTSYGGQVPTSGQMSIARWLEVGATGSFGTVVEPCNYPMKFPVTSRVLPHYFRGETLIEAYWKSVQWPGEGLFVGEPLARPWGSRVTLEADRIVIETTILDPAKVYEVVAGPSVDGPFEVVLPNVTVPNHRLAELSIEPAGAFSAYYVLRALP